MLWRRRKLLCSLAAVNFVELARPALSQPAFPPYERFVTRATVELTTEWQFFSARVGLREQYLFFSDVRISAADSPNLTLRRAAPRNIERFRRASELVSGYLRDAITKVGPPFGTAVMVTTFQIPAEIDSTFRSSFEENVMDMDSIIAFVSFFKERAAQIGRFEFTALTDEEIFVGQMKSALICNTLLPRDMMVGLLPASPFFIFCPNRA